MCITGLICLSWATGTVYLAPWHPLCESLSWKAIVLSPLAKPRLQTRRGWSKGLQINLGLSQKVEPGTGVGWLLVQKEGGMPLITFLPLFFLFVCLGSPHQCVNVCLCECVRAWASTPCLLFRLQWTCKGSNTLWVESDIKSGWWHESQAESDWEKHREGVSRGRQ